MRLTVMLQTVAIVLAASGRTVRLQSELRPAAWDGSPACIIIVMSMNTKIPLPRYPFGSTSFFRHIWYELTMFCHTM